MKRFISYLYKRFVNPDITEIVRKQLHLVTDPMSQERFYSLPDDKRIDFLKSCWDLNQNEILKQILDGMMVIQRDETFSKGETGEHFLHGKIHFHAYGLIREVLQNYANQYEEETKKNTVEGSERYDILDV